MRRPSTPWRNGPKDLATMEGIAQASVTLPLPLERPRGQAATPLVPSACLVQPSVQARRLCGGACVPQPTTSGPHRTTWAPVMEGRTAPRRRLPLCAGSHLSSRSRQREQPPSGAAMADSVVTGPAWPNSHHPPPPAAGGLPGQRAPLTTRQLAGRLRRAVPRPASTATRHRAGSSARSGARPRHHRQSRHLSGGSRGLSPG